MERSKVDIELWDGTREIETCGYREEGRGPEVEQENLGAGQQLWNHCGVPTPSAEPG